MTDDDDKRLLALVRCLNHPQRDANHKAVDGKGKEMSLCDECFDKMKHLNGFGISGGRILY